MDARARKQYRYHKDWQSHRSGEKFHQLIDFGQDLRTWAGSLAAFTFARNSIQKGIRPSVKEMSEASAEVLHNTPAISRSSYIHPLIIDLADKQHTLEELAFTPLVEPLRGLRADENRLLDFLIWRREECEAALLQKAS